MKGIDLGEVIWVGETLWRSQGCLALERTPLYIPFSFDLYVNQLRYLKGLAKSWTVHIDVGLELKSLAGNPVALSCIWEVGWHL